jgi:hypothetical protein
MIINEVKTLDLSDTRKQMQRAYACFRAITKQLFGHTTRELEAKVKSYIMLDACEHGYPYEIVDGKCKPMSLAKANKVEFHLVNIAINHFADQYYPQLGRSLYLYQEDQWGLYKSIGGRSREQMWQEYPAL